MIDCYFKIMPFPKGKTHEAITENEDGSHTVFIDSNLPFEHQRAYAVHAVCHIRNCDFDKYDVQKIEAALCET